jgi:hypothetical protein
VRVQGLLQQRDTQETLQRALERLIADDNVKKTLLDRFDGELTRLRLSRSEIEVVVFGWEIVRPPRQKTVAKPKAAPVAVESQTETTEAPAEGQPGRRARGKKPALGAEAITPAAAAEVQPAAPAA